jgi:hypothetical protein
MEVQNTKDEVSLHEENPPFFRSWKNMYYFVFGQLLFLIFLFYLFTLYFS